MVTVAARAASRAAALSFDGPVVVDVSQRVEGDGAARVVTLTGAGFGPADLTLRASLPPLGCASTGWVSDSALLCSLGSGFVSGDVTIAAIRAARVTRVCGADETLAQAAPASLGQCRRCAACPAGRYRDCEPGGVSTGECLACPNDGLPREQRTFKAAEGDAATKCAPCTVCGGAPGAGALYEVQRCTATADAACAACAACPAGQTRVGCAGAFGGSCERLPNGTETLKATVSGAPGSAVNLGDGQTLLATPLRVALADGTGVSFPVNAVVRWPGGAPANISVTVVTPRCVCARARKRGVVAARVGRRGARRPAARAADALAMLPQRGLPPPHPHSHPRTNRTRRVTPPVLIGRTTSPPPLPQRGDAGGGGGRRGLRRGRRTRASAPPPPPPPPTSLLLPLPMSLLYPVPRAPPHSPAGRLTLGRAARQLSEVVFFAPSGLSSSRPANISLPFDLAKVGPARAPLLPAAPAALRCADGPCGGRDRRRSRRTGRLSRACSGGMRVPGGGRGGTARPSTAPGASHTCPPRPSPSMPSWRAPARRRAPRTLLARAAAVPDARRRQMPAAPVDAGTPGAGGAWPLMYTILIALPSAFVFFCLCCICVVRPARAAPRPAARAPTPRGA